jgi:hypothetical protein
MPANKLQKSDNQILHVFGVSLIASGFAPFIKTWNDLKHLVDEDGAEIFSDYFSEQRFNSEFVERFFAARLEASAVAGWDDETLNRKLFRTDPTINQSIKSYYETNFLGAIRPAPKK